MEDLKNQMKGPTPYSANADFGAQNYYNIIPPYSNQNPPQVNEENNTFEKFISEEVSKVHSAVVINLAEVKRIDNEGSGDSADVFKGI